MNSIDRFWGEYRWLSNFYPSLLNLDGRDYPTVEHYYQASKASTEEDHEFVRLSPSPGEAKERGQKIPLRIDWEENKVSVMRYALEAKFQNTGLRTALLETGDLQLEEGNTWGDTFWGVCRGKGQNYLGRLLMEIRETLRCLS